MKTSIFSIKSVIMCAILVMATFCGTSAYAEGADNYVVNKVGNTQFVYSTDATGMYLTPKFKYVYSNPAKNIEVKTALYWSINSENWIPDYEVTTEVNQGLKTMTYARWDSMSQTYGNTERMVYQLDNNNQPTTCQYMQWDKSSKAWAVK